MGGQISPILLETKALPWKKIKNLSVSQTGFVFDQQNGHSFSVNETGLEILTGLIEGKDLASIKRMLLLNYDVLPETVDTAINHFIDLLIRQLP